MARVTSCGVYIFCHFAQMKEADLEAEKTAKSVDKEDPDYKPPADA